MDDKELNEQELNDLKQKISQEPRSRRIFDTGDGDNVVGWFERIVKIVSTYGMKKVILTYITVAAFIALIMFASAVDNQHIIEQWLIGQQKEHVDGNNVRKEINPKINASIIKLLYKAKADRVSVLEMHNGKENPTSLPFLYCDMTYEEVSDSVMYISEEYSDLNMSKYTFPDYLYKHRYFIGDLHKIYTIDKKLALRLEANGTVYCSVMLIRTSEDIGFLMLSYTSTPKITDAEILAELSYYAQEIGTYLDYTKQVENN